MHSEAIKIRSAFSPSRMQRNPCPSSPMSAPDVEPIASGLHVQEEHREAVALLLDLVERRRTRE
jgi:hypothetical protein